MIATVIRLKEVMRIRFSLLCFFIFVTVVAVVSGEAARHLIAIAEERSERENSLRLIALEGNGVRMTRFWAFTLDGSSGISPRYICFPGMSEQKILEQLPLLKKIRPIEDAFAADVLFLNPKLFADTQFTTRIQNEFQMTATKACLKHQFGS